MPDDIVTDLCYRRRGEVIEYLARKYGSDQVAQIITFGTLAARAVIRDVGRISAVCMLIVLLLMDARLSVSFMHTMIMIVTGFIVYMVLLVLMRDEMVWEGIRLIKARINATK